MERPSVLHLIGRVGAHAELIEHTTATKAVRRTVADASPRWADGGRRPALVHAHGAEAAAAARRMARGWAVPWVLSPGLDVGASPGEYEPDLWLVESPTSAVALAAAGISADRIRRVGEGIVLPVMRAGALDEPVLVVPASGAAQGRRALALHAQAAGTVCIAIRDDLLADVLAPEAPMVDNEAEIAGVADRLRSDGSYRATLSGAARRHVALRFEAGSRAADLDEHYRSLVACGRPAPQREALAEWPSVSVIIPTYNRRELLAQTLDAMEAQTYPRDKLEVVVVDDASTDGTDGVLSRRRPPWRFRALRNEENLLAAGARNRALAECTGEIVAFTDDDCRPHPTWLESLVSGFSSGVSVVQGRTVADPRQRLEPLSRTQWTPAEYGLYETANIAYRRPTLDVFGPAPFASIGPRVGNMIFAEDTYLAWRAKRAGAVTRFASTAVVDHHVYDPDVRYLFRRALLAGGFPLLVRSVPELRDVFLWRRVFLGPRHAALVGALAAGVLVGRRRPLVAAAAATPYVEMILQPRRRGGRRARLRAAPVLVVRDLLELAALLRGSARARTPVL